jgi:hypothetical protein
MDSQYNVCTQMSSSQGQPTAASQVRPSTCCLCSHMTPLHLRGMHSPDCCITHMHDISTANMMEEHYGPTWDRRYKVIAARSRSFHF